LPRRAKIRPDQPGLERIEQAALELFAERGYDATSIAAIGDRAGITKSVIYHHFGSKSGLYTAVCTRQTADLVEAVRQVVSDDSKRARFRDGVDAYLSFLAERPAAWQLLLRDRPAEPALAELHERLEAERTEAMTRLLAGPRKRISQAQHLDLVAVAIRAYAGWWFGHPDVRREKVAEAIMAFARSARSL
jgi:AcrR family transcriptional regulator